MLRRVVFIIIVIIVVIFIIITIIIIIIIIIIIVIITIIIMIIIMKYLLSLIEKTVAMSNFSHIYFFRVYIFLSLDLYIFHYIYSDSGGILFLV